MDVSDRRPRASILQTRTANSKGNGNVSSMASSYYDRSRQRHFDRQVAWADRERKDEMFGASGWRSLNEAQIDRCNCAATIFFSHLVSLEQLARRVARLHNYGFQRPKPRTLATRIVTTSDCRHDVEKPMQQLFLLFIFTTIVPELTSVYARSVVECFRSTDKREAGRRRNARARVLKTRFALLTCKCCGAIQQQRAFIFLTAYLPHAEACGFQKVCYS